ncbi:ino80 complex subunit e [Plakobranchus ocellatus]|uniref:Ino80 complex subunit e n=1 Tax=Plakobranchus ocellatus TaxID=259542 RepID=A0AAV4DH00_9GAST|nr:ino80 complex subunit e [Plakobranchus ocellatus]
MPVTEETAGVSEEFAESHIDYKQKYKGLKKKLRLLVYEQECFLDELRKAQRKLLKVARDRSFLLDRLLQQEKIEDSSDESEATNSTDTEDVLHSHREAVPAKKRKLANQTSDLAHMLSNSAKAGSQSDSHSTKKKAKSSGKKASKSSSSKLPAVKQESPGQMTREELERHLESKQHHEFGIEKATASLPMEIFSNENNHESDAGGEAEEEEDDLVIDVPH